MEFIDLGILKNSLIHLENKRRTEHLLINLIE